MRKICSYCGCMIVGEAKDVSEESPSGAHPPMWWHLTWEDCHAAAIADLDKARPSVRRLLSAGVTAESARGQA